MWSNTASAFLRIRYHASSPPAQTILRCPCPVQFTTANVLIARIQESLYAEDSAHIIGRKNRAKQSCPKQSTAKNMYHGINPLLGKKKRHRYPLWQIITAEDIHQRKKIHRREYPPPSLLTGHTFHRRWYPPQT